MRHNGDTFGSEKIFIYEPCNYASSMAFYRSVTRICAYQNWTSDTQHLQAINRIFSSKAVSSAFWKGSYTYLGHELDDKMITLLAYLGHQASIAGLKVEDQNSSILRELSITPRNQSALDISTNYTHMFVSLGADQWSSILDDADLPRNVSEIFVAMAAGGAALLLPEAVATDFIAWLAGATLSAGEAEFIVKHYLPVFFEAVKDIHLTLESKIELTRKITGVAIKMFWASLW